MNTINPKRILLLTPSMSKGGAEKQLFKIAMFLHNKGYQVKILSLCHIDEFKGALKRSGLPVVFLKSWKNNPYSNCRKLYHEFQEWAPDIVISFMFIAIIFGRILKRHFHFKLISSIRISVLPRKWYLPFNMTSGDDAIVYNSAASQQLFEKKFPRLKPGTVIHNDISIPSGTCIKQADKKIFTWVCIGHFRWNKDYQTLFKALAKIKSLDFRVIVIGELSGALWPMLLLRELKLSARVTLMGFVADPESYLSHADGFVLSSFAEGMPNAILEAMALAKPVVVTDIECNRELIAACGGGLLSKPKDVADLAACLVKVMDMTLEERAEMGARGRNYISGNFQEKGVMQQWENLLEQV